MNGQQHTSASWTSGIGLSGANEGPPPSIALRSIEETAPLDAVALALHLHAVGWRLDLDFTPRQFAGGLANLNYLLRIDGKWHVLRRPPSGLLPPGANDMTREHRILSRLWRVLPLAPRSFYLCDDASVIGAPFQILEFRDGVVLRGDCLSPLPETLQTGAALSAMLIETLARIHSVPPEAVGLETLGRPQGFFSRTVTGWLDRASIVTDDNLPPAAREVKAWLVALPGINDASPVLLHNDFKLDNILLDPDSLSPSTVVDWDMGTRGPALFDLATLLSYWTEPGDPECMQRLAQMPTARPGFLSREATATAYSGATGRSIAEIRPYRVLTILKLAVVFHQLHRRYATGDTRDPRYATFGSLGDELFAFALDVARGRVF